MEQAKLYASDILKLLNIAEQDFDVDAWIIEDMHVWPLLRIMLWSKMDTIREGSNKSNCKSDLLKKAVIRSLDLPAWLLRLLMSYFTDYQKNDKLRDIIDVLFLCFAPSRRIKANSLWIDVFSDPLREIVERKRLRCATLEFSQFDTFSTPRLNTSKYIDFSLVYLKYVSGIKANRVHISKQLTRKMNDLFEFLANRRVGYYLPDIYFIKRTVCYIRLVADYFKQLIKKVNPYVVFMTNYYSAIGMAMNLACSEAGITSVDIQHGVQGAYHPAYARWLNLPECGYELLPNVFMVWSPEEELEIRKWADELSKHHIPIVGGNIPMACYEYIKRETSNDDGSTLKQLAHQHNVTHILITLQYGRFFSNIYKESICSLKCDEVFWWIRCHPLSNKEERDYIVKELKLLNVPKVNTREASEYPLYSLLEFVDIHITQNSSVVIEANNYGVPSIVVHPSGMVQYQDNESVVRGGLFLCETAREVCDKIEQLGRLKNRVRPSAAINVRAIDNILQMSGL